MIYNWHRTLMQRIRHEVLDGGNWGLRKTLVQFKALQYDSHTTQNNALNSCKDSMIKGSSQNARIASEHPSIIQNMTIFLWNPAPVAGSPTFVLTTVALLAMISTWLNNVCWCKSWKCANTCSSRTLRWRDTMLYNYQQWNLVGHTNLWVPPKAGMSTSKTSMAPTQ